MIMIITAVLSWSLSRPLMTMPSELKRYVVELSLDERDALERLVHTGRVAAHKRRHAQILLAVDESEHGAAMSDADAAEQIGVAKCTIVRARQRCVCEGLEPSLERKPRRREKSRRLDGDAEARLVSLACSEPPSGQARWTLRLLSKKLVELEIVESVCHETVRRVLKKHHQTLAA